MSELFDAASDSQLKAELGKRLEARVEQLKKQVDSYTKTIEGKQTELTSITHLVTQAREDLHGVEVRRDQALDETLAAKKSLKEAQQAHQEDIAASETELHNLEETTQQSLQQLREQIDALNGQIDQKLVDIDVIDGIIANKNNTITSLNSTIAVINEEIATVQSNKQDAVVELDEVIKDKERQITAFDTKIASLKEEADKLVAANQKQVKEMNAKRRELKAYEEKLNRFEDSLKIKFEALNNDKEDFKSQQRRLGSIEHLSEL